MRIAERLRLLHGSAFTPVWILALLWLVFAALSPQFRRPEVFAQVLEHSASTAIVAIGMTFVLLTSGIDLSVGAVMLVAGAVAGKMIFAGFSIPAAVMAMLLVGVGVGTLNGILITRLKMMPFVVTLATLFIVRGIGLWITETRPLNLPDAFRVIATGKLLSIAIPIWLLAASSVAAHLVLTRTPFGRQLYAIGHDAAAARTAGIPFGRHQVIVYALSGFFAAIGGVITLSQLNTVSPTLGQGKELEAIAAAVLGGVSLFGGWGGPFGAVVGALLIQTIYSGLNIVDADPQVSFDIDEYYYPIITCGIVFLAVLVDSLRKSWTERATRPMIRPMDFRLSGKT